MKKPAKLLSLSLCCTLAAACLPLSAVSASAAEIDDIDDMPSITIETDDNGTTTYYDEDGNEVSLSDLNRSVGAGDTELPSSYDLRDYNRVTPVRNQQDEGYCWAFASTASIESNILSQPSLVAELGDDACKTLHLSETASAWFLSTNIEDTSSILYNDYNVIDGSHGSGGGLPSVYGIALSAGYGTYPASLCPYSGSSINRYDESLRYYSSYALDDYSEYSPTDIEGVKAAIIENGAVTVGYMDVRGDDDIGCYSTDLMCYCDLGYNEKRSGGHEVTVVGWDDNYSRENFNENYLPENDGAWLCKNSWGEDVHDGGYFWMSYETQIDEFSSFTVQSIDEYDNRYQNSVSYSVTGFAADKSANVFTAESSETLEQVSIGTVGKYDYEISIYKLNDNYTSPEDGTLLTTVSGSVDLLGIHSIDITDEVYLESGEVFSVVVENKTADDAYLMYDDVDKNRTYKIAYHKAVGGDWTDSAEAIDNGAMVGYPLIKAFTKNTDNSALFDELSQTIETAEAFAASAENTSQTELDKLNEQISASKAVLNEKSCGAVEINNNIILLEKQMKVVKYSGICEIGSVGDYCDVEAMLIMGEISPEKIVLTADLDFEGEEIYPLMDSNGEYSIDFDGNGHTVRTAALVANNDVDQEVMGFFGKLKDVEISNVTFEQCMSKQSIVCYSANGAVFTDISVVDCTVSPDELGYASASCSAFAFCGVDNSSAENCSVTGCTIIGDAASDFCVNAGESSFTVKDCRTSDNTVITYSSGYIFCSDTQSNKYVYAYNDNYTRNNKAYLSITTDGNVTLYTCKEGIVDVRAEEDIELVTRGENQYDFRLTGENGTIAYTEVIPEGEECFFCKISLTTGKMILSCIDESYFENYDGVVEIPSTLGGTEVGMITGFDEISDSLILPSVSEEYGASIKKLIIPDSITQIRDGVLSYFSNIESLTVGSGMTEISNSWFGSDTYLTNLKELNLSDETEIIDKFAFAGALITSYTFGKNIMFIEKCSVGYSTRTIPWERDRLAKIPNVVINGYAGTAAETYAEENGFTFVDLSTSEAVVSAPLDSSIYTAGDVNLDGTVDICDATEIQKYLVNITEFNDIQLVNCKVYTCSKTLDIRNATAIQKYLAGIYDVIDPSGVLKSDSDSSSEEKGPKG